MVAAHTKLQQGSPTLRTTEQTPADRGLRAKCAGRIPQSTRGNPGLTNLPPIVLAGLTMSPVLGGTLQAAKLGVPVEGKCTKTPGEMLGQRYPNRNSRPVNSPRVSDFVAQQDRDPAGHRVVGCCGRGLERPTFTVIEDQRFAFQCEYQALGGRRGHCCFSITYCAHNRRRSHRLRETDTDSTIRMVAVADSLPNDRGAERRNLAEQGHHVYL
jgi:hypothetical protein